MGFLHLLWRCVSMFLEGRHSIELNRPNLLNYLNNIENIGWSERAAPCRACLIGLDDQARALDNLQRANITAIMKIEIAC